MRVRIIFRGLTLFTFEKGSTANATAGSNLGELTAWLISDPAHAGKGGLHEHRPLLGFIGRDATAPRRHRLVETGLEVPRDLNLELMGHGTPSGVIVDGSFLDYVPRLGALHWAEPQSIRENFITRRIVIPSGTIRTREFIAWDWYGNTPAQVAYMDTRFQGFGANEVIVEIGDDSDMNKNDKSKHLAVKSTSTKIPKELWPFTKGTDLMEEAEPNTLEILITNLTARRRRPIFWGLHYQSLFQAAGFPPRDGYENGDQYDAFVRAAMEYDPFEWRSDRDAMGIGHPFPFLIDIDRESDKLEAIKEADTPYILRGPPPAPGGRQKDEGLSRSQRSGHNMGGGMHAGHDPVNTQICPHGRL